MFIQANARVGPLLVRRPEAAENTFRGALGIQARLPPGHALEPLAEQDSLGVQLGNRGICDLQLITRRVNRVESKLGLAAMTSR